MPDLSDGETARVQGSAREPYVLKNVGGVYSCSCAAWRNQSRPIDRRTCKHIKLMRGAAAEAERIGEVAETVPAMPAKPVLAPKLLLAQTWDNDRDLTGWWASEKLDGVRAWWTGRQVVSRNGNAFYAPEWFTMHLPSMQLDGELWIDRKAFQRTVSIVRRQDAGELWRQVKYLVFDSPGMGGPFEYRQTQIQQAIGRLQLPHLRVLEQAICRGTDHLRQRLDEVESLGGEGLMLRQPESSYVSGRSDTLLKIKRFRETEARIVEHLPGSGRHKGRLGALLVELPSGVRFHVGTGFSDRERESPPPVGETITFRYQELSDGGVPRFPSFVRVRSDTRS